MINLYPVGLGELFAGTYGVKCKECDNNTWTVWLTEDEYNTIKDMGDPRHIICVKNLGINLCYHCGQKYRKIGP